MTSTEKEAAVTSLATVLVNRSTPTPSAKNQPSADSELHESWRDIEYSAGRRYTRCRFGNYECKSGTQQEDAKKAVENYAKSVAEHVEQGHGLLLFGPPGTGKDHLLFACVFQACRAGKSVVWRNGLDWFGSLRDRIDRGGDEETAVRSLVACDVLALSDPLPPHGDLSSYQGQMLLRVIDRRYRHQKSTWVTMNVADRKEAESRMGAPLVDRLADGALAVHCNWKSWRSAL